MANTRTRKSLKAAADRARQGGRTPEQITDELPAHLLEGIADVEMTTQAQIAMAMSRIFRATATGKLALSQATRYTFLLSELAKAIERRVDEQARGGAGGGAGFQGLKVIGPAPRQIIDATPTDGDANVGSDGRRAGDNPGNGTERPAR